MSSHKRDRFHTCNHLTLIATREHILKYITEFYRLLLMIYQSSQLVCILYGLYLYPSYWSCIGSYNMYKKLNQDNGCVVDWWVHFTSTLHGLGLIMYVRSFLKVNSFHLFHSSDISESKIQFAYLPRYLHHTKLLRKEPRASWASWEPQQPVRVESFNPSKKTRKV